RQLPRRGFSEVVFAMIGEHVRNSLRLESRLPHEGHPPVQKRSFELWIRRDRDVRVEKQATCLERREDRRAERLLVLDGRDGEDRHRQLEGSFRERGVQVLVEKVDASAGGGQAG